MKEEFEQELRIEEPIQTLTGPPGAPGGTTATNFQNFPDDDINTYPGGSQAFYSRPGVCYNTGGAANIGQYANFTDGNSGFLIYSENAAKGLNLVARKKSKADTTWSSRYVLYHSGNLTPKDFALKTYVDDALKNKVEKTYVDTKADTSYVNNQYSLLQGKLNSKVNITDLPRIICTGYVGPQGDIRYNGQPVGCSRPSAGEYHVYPLNDAKFPTTYTVSVTLDSNEPDKYYSASNLCGDEFKVNVKFGSTSSTQKTDSGFHFLMVQY